MYRQFKDICTCILLYISITCTNGLLCYSCFGDKNDALDCNIITCKPSLSGDLRTACYYQVFESGHQRRGCENVTSELSQLIEDNMALYYCREDYCNGYSNVFLNDTQHQYKSRETQAPDLKSSWNSTADAYSSSTQDNTQSYSIYTNTLLVIMIICVIVAIICLCYFMFKSKCQDVCFCCYDISGDYSVFDCCDNNTNHRSDISYNIANSNCGGQNDVGSGGNDDGGGDCAVGGDGAADCRVNDDGATDCGGGGCCGDDCGGGGCCGDDGGGDDCGGGDCGGSDCSCGCVG